jgi:hypothetical protein
LVVCLPHCWHGLLLIEIAITKNELVKTQVNAEEDAYGSALQLPAAALPQQ